MIIAFEIDIISLIEIKYYIDVTIYGNTFII